VLKTKRFRFLVNVLKIRTFGLFSERIAFVARPVQRAVCNPWGWHCWRSWWNQQK